MYPGSVKINPIVDRIEPIDINLTHGKKNVFFPKEEPLLDADGKKLGTIRVIQFGKGAERKVVKAYIKLDDPALINNEDVLSYITSYTKMAKSVEINLGKSNEKSNYYADEIIEFKKEEIEKLHDQKFNATKRTEQIHEGWLSLLSLGKTYLFVEITKLQEEESLKEEEITIPEKTVENISMSDYRKNNNIITKIANNYEPDDLEDTGQLIGKGHTVEYFNDESEINLSYGIFVRKGMADSEVEIYLNHNEDFKKEVLLTKILDYFITSGKTVLVNWDQVDPGTLKEKLDYESVYGPIREITSMIEVSRLIMADEKEYTCAIFHP